MAETITIPDLENGKVDIDTLADIVNLQEPTTETRLSGPVNTWFGVQSSLTSVTGLAYTSKPAMDAAPGTVVGQVARVTEGADSGLYIWSGSAWVKTDDPIESYLDDIDSLTINKGKNFPLLASTRDGIVSPAGTETRTYWPLTMLSAYVYGPKDLVSDKYFRIVRFYNGSAGRYGLTIAEYPKDTYDTASQETIIESGLIDYGLRYGTGVQVITITPESRPEIKFKVSVDTNELPVNGTPLNANVSTLPCWSWVIHPDRVFEMPESSLSGGQGNLSVEVESSVVRVGNASDSDCYRWSFGPNGLNNLPNMVKIDRSTGNDIHSAEWVAASAFTTDFIGPLIFQKAGVTFRNNVFTGGNHLVDTYQTAQNIHNEIYVDGIKRDSFTGFAKFVDVYVAHRIMAANTVVAPGSVTDDSYVALQKIWVRFYENGAVVVEGEVMALQDAVFQRDYALQAVVANFNDTVMVSGGQQGGRIPWAADILSGAASDYPNADIFVTQSAANGQLACWFERDFGVDVRVIDQTESLIRGSSTKMYQLAVWSSTGLALSAGQSYKWRGGYFLSSDRTPMSTIIDSVVNKGEGFLSVLDNGFRV